MILAAASPERCSGTATSRLAGSVALGQLLKLFGVENLLHATRALVDALNGRIVRTLINCPDAFNQSKFRVLGWIGLIRSKQLAKPLAVRGRYVDVGGGGDRLQL